MDRGSLGGVGWNCLGRNTKCASPYSHSLYLSHPKLCTQTGRSGVKFFFPDSQDFVDASFDFGAESRSSERIRQRDDLYPHEILTSPPYDGLLVSKAVVDGHGGGVGKYSSAQRQRFLRVGVREYFRLQTSALATMGDCGAFTYVKDPRPPYSVPEVADFYQECGFDFGLSVDHVILAYRAALD